MSDLKPALMEEEALALLAFLTVSAECCLREPPDYGEFRLMTAASQLAEAWVSRCEDEQTAALLTDLIERIPAQTARRTADPEGFMAFLSECNAAVAQEIKRRGKGQAE